MASVLAARMSSLLYPRPPSTDPRWCGTSVDLRGGKLVPLNDMFCHSDPDGSDNLRCSIFEQGDRAPILQQHATTGKLRRERTHTFFSLESTTRLNTPTIFQCRSQSCEWRQLLSPT